MGKKRFAKDPLLYIHQPSIGTPKAPMQSNYTASGKPKHATVNETTQGTQSLKQPIRKTAFEKQFNKPKEENKKQVTMDEEPGDTESKTNDDSVKFKDRTLEGKVAYFTDAPELAPKMRCEVKTEDRTYRGYIVNRQEDDVYMHSGKRSLKIPMTKIKNIRMLGF